LYKTLHGTEDSRVTAALADAAAAVLAALRAHPEMEELQSTAYFALNTVASAKGGQQHAVAAGGIEQAVATLRAPGSERVHWRACTALAAMCHRHHEVRGATAGGFEAAIGFMRANPTVERAQLAGCSAVFALVSSYDPRQQIKAAIAGAVEAVVAALRGAQSGELQGVACYALYYMAAKNKGIETRARTAGALEAIATALAGEATGGEVEQSGRLDAGCSALNLLIAGEEDWAVRAGAVEALQKHAATATPPDSTCSRLLAHLQPATQRHDASPCTHAGCRRCAGMRARGLMCALAGCGIRKREGGKRLQRCVTCRSARYCSAAHYQEDWQRHRLECAALRARLSDAGDD
jgi:hypothetical protein